MLYFENDYCEGAHPAILQKLVETNFEKVSGYGTDPYCASAREKIRAACGAPDADVWFISGGTQSNAIVIASMLRRWEGVLAASTGHVAAHEPVLSSSRATRSSACRTPTASWMPGLLRTGAGPSIPMAMWTTSCFRAWCTSPTPSEYGTLYTKQNWKRCPLSAISTTCRCLWTVPVWAMVWPPRAPM